MDLIIVETNTVLGKSYIMVCPECYDATVMVRKNASLFTEQEVEFMKAGYIVIIDSDLISHAYLPMPYIADTAVVQ